MVTPRRQTGLFILTLTIFLAISTNSYQIPTGIKLELTHRVRLDRVKQFVHQDTARLRATTHKVKAKNNDISYSECVDRNKTRNAHQMFGEMPLNSAADYGSGQYHVHFNVGTPAQRVQLVVDTGSDLTWTKCKYRCRGKCRRRLVKARIFRADQSASFRTVPCSSDVCRVELANLFSLSRCASPADPCAYDYRYGDGSSAQGLFADETITFRMTNGRKRKLHNMLIGCSESSSGQSFQSADGVMGLGHSNHSFAVRASKYFGGKFSYCLVDHLSPRNITSFLIFGSHKEAHISLRRRRMRYTKLVLGVIDPFYAVSIKGISVGGAMMDIPTGGFVVNSTGGTIIDSGSSLTSLTLPAYNPVMDALKLSLSRFRNLNLDIGGLEYCFNSTGFQESSVPRLVFHFTNGARFEPPVKSYVIDVAPGLKCIGLIPAASPGASVIGNIMQQNHLWEFDLVNGRLGFASSSCR